MTDRELMQQALDALDSDNPDIQLRTAIALRERLAQPEQEPVAKYSDIVSDGGLDPRNKFDDPPQRPWVGLTDEELSELSASGLALWELWRAIEAKLKEKNT
jgi:hypothetical protein